MINYILKERAQKRISTFVQQPVKNFKMLFILTLNVI